MLAKYGPFLECVEEDDPGALSLPELPETLPPLRMEAGCPDFETSAPAVRISADGEPCQSGYQIAVKRVLHQARYIVNVQFVHHAGTIGVYGLWT